MQSFSCAGFLSSWIARVAAPYDLSAADLVSTLLPNERNIAGMDGRIDYEAVPPLEAALRESVGKPGSGFHRLRLPGIEANPQAA
jgi:hypothetical protein